MPGLDGGRLLRPRAVLASGTKPLLKYPQKLPTFFKSRWSATIFNPDTHQVMVIGYAHIQENAGLINGFFDAAVRRVDVMKQKVLFCQGAIIFNILHDGLECMVAINKNKIKKLPDSYDLAPSLFQRAIRVNEIIYQVVLGINLFSIENIKIVRIVADPGNCYIIRAFSMVGADNL